MAKQKAVWGIDIGQCALKALKCRIGDDREGLLAEAFDYIEYPKILSQPEAEPAELIRGALEQFLSRNVVKGDRVAVSVPGQAGLARFIKLPPVESKKIADIVKYEARQQIPFALEEVVWDFTRMPGGSESDGFVLDTEVGLFAMKREQVYRSLKPFVDAGIEVDIVQLTPLALYNFVCFDQITDLPKPEDYNPERPPESIVVLSLGTDTTDIVITNGFRVWQRNIPLGGNHFTKALTKELKVTFAKAEHLKRNATQQENAKQIFQAMRPVFNDLLSEVQRSVGYFSNIDRTARITRVLALGNAMKLQGLQKFLAQSLGLEVTRLESFRNLAGPAVVDAPSFKENLPGFGVTYGLCLQGLRDTTIATNLVPREMLTTRIIREKKPWAVAAAATLMLGFTTNFFGNYNALSYVHDDRFGAALKEADGTISYSGTQKSNYETAKQQYNTYLGIGGNLVHDVEAKLLWMELMKTVNVCLPTDVGEVPAELSRRKQIYVTSIESRKVDDVKTWFDANSKWYLEAKEGLAARPVAPSGDNPAPPATGDGTQASGDPPAPPADGGAQGGVAGSASSGTEGQSPAPPPADGSTPPPAPGGAAGPAAPPAGTDPAAPTAAGTPDDPAAPADPGPTGKGWIVQITGFHFHNHKDDPENTGAQFVRRTFIHNLVTLSIPVVVDAAQPPVLATTKDLGIGYPMVIDPGLVNWDYVLREDHAKPTGPGGPGNMGGSDRDGSMGLPGGGDSGMPAGAGGGAGMGLGGGGGMMPGASGGAGMGLGGGMGPSGMGGTGTIGSAQDQTVVPRFDFVIQFCWIETPETERIKKLRERPQQTSGQMAASDIQQQGTGTSTGGGN
jgi:type IV pilus assembly protein PilM